MLSLALHNCYCLNLESWFGEDNKNRNTKSVIWYYADYMRIRAQQSSHETFLLPASVECVPDQMVR